MKSFLPMRTKGSELFFYPALVMFIAQEYIETSRYIDIFGYTVVASLKWVAVLGFVLSIALTRNVKRTTLTVSLGFSLFLSIIYFYTERYTLLIILIVLLASRKYPTHKVIRFVYYVSLIFLVFIVVSSLLGIIPNITIVQSGGERIRNTLGFDYVSFSSNYFVNILLCRIYLKSPNQITNLSSNGTMSLKEISVWLLASCILYFETKTNLTFLVSIIAIVLYMFFVKLRFLIKFYKFKYSLIMFIFIVLWTITFYCCLKYNSHNQIWATFNQYTTNRLWLSNEAIMRYGIHLFGSKINMNSTDLGSTNIYIDSGYIQLIVLYGTFLTSIFLLIYTFLVRLAIQTKNVGLLIWLVCVALFNVVNSMTFDLLQNSSLLVIWMLEERRNCYIREI